MTTTKPVLQHECTSSLCRHPAGPSHYEMPGRCMNCHSEFTLLIPWSHRAPTVMGVNGWDCSRCGCRYEVTAVKP